MNGPRYLQLFVWDNGYTQEELAEHLELKKPTLIEWIAPYEVHIEGQRQYDPLLAYKKKYPKTRVRILTNNGLGHYQNKRDGFIYESYPLMFFIDTIFTYGEDQIKNFTQTEKFKYKLISMNNNGHYFRCLMIDYFEKYKLLNDPLSLISWRNKSTDHDYTYRWFEPRTIAFDDPLTPSGSIDAYKLIPQYHECFLNVVAESSPTHLFVTEKTIKPMVWMKPFIILGCQGYNKFLKRKLGFELFEEFIDYSFDDEEDLETRVEMFVKEVDRLSFMSISAMQTMYKKILPKLQHNKQRVLDIIKDRSYDPKVVVEWKQHRVNEVQGNKELSMPQSHRQDHWYYITKQFNIL